MTFPKCKKCKTTLIEEYEGFPLGFLSCPQCAEENEKLKSIQKKLITMMESSSTDKIIRLSTKEKQLLNKVEVQYTKK